MRGEQFTLEFTTHSPYNRGYERVFLSPATEILLPKREEFSQSGKKREEHLQTPLLEVQFSVELL